MLANSTASGVFRTIQCSPLSATEKEQQVGTQNYAHTPAAVFVGGGHDDAGIEAMRNACTGCKYPVPWLKQDTGKAAPPLGPGYGEVMAERVKKCLQGLEREGRMVGDGKSDAKSRGVQLTFLGSWHSF